MCRRHQISALVVMCTSDLLSALDMNWSNLSSVNFCSLAAYYHCGVVNSPNLWHFLSIFHDTVDMPYFELPSFKMSRNAHARQVSVLCRHVKGRGDKSIH